MKIPSPILLATLSLAVGCQSAPPSSSGDSDPSPVPSAEGSSSTLSPSTLDGIYTAAQADRGRQVYETICSDCHQPEDWTDTVFLSRWNEESVYRFWFWIYENMPDGEPPYALEREQVTDVLTYILQLNGLPTGPTELGPDDDSLDDHWLVWNRP